MDSFYNDFCKVEFSCHQGEPYWLGCLILIPFFLFILVASYRFIFVFYHMGYMKVIEYYNLI